MLSRIAAAGLAGGRSARVELARAVRSRDESEVVVACLAGAKSLPVAQLLQIVDDKRREEVERLAAWVALLVSDHAVTSKLVDKFRTRERRFGRLGALLAAVCRPSLALPKLPKLERQAARGTLANLEFRASLLLAIVRPGVFDSATLEDALQAARPADRALAALCLGRRLRKDTVSEEKLRLRLSRLEAVTRGHFVLGLGRVGESILDELATPGATLNAEERSLHWSVLAASSMASKHAALLPALIEADQDAEEAFQVLSRRLLLEPGFELRVDQSVKDALVDGQPRRWRCLVGLLLGEAALDDKRRTILGSRCAAALALQREGRLGRNAIEGRALLSRHARHDDWVRVEAGTPNAVLVRGLNALVREAFLAGSEIATRQGISGELPRGIRAVKTPYFEVLEHFTRVYPPFRDSPKP